MRIASLGGIAAEHRGLGNALPVSQAAAARPLPVRRNSRRLACRFRCIFRFAPKGRRYVSPRGLVPSRILFLLGVPLALPVLPTKTLAEPVPPPPCGQTGRLTVHGC